MADVIEVSRVEELAEYRLAWESLLSETPGASFFHSLDWLRAYWEHFGKQKRLRVLVVLDEGRPLGIVPMVLRRERTRLGWLRVLGYPLDDWGSFYGPIGPAQEQTLVHALAWIKAGPADWDLLELRGIEAGSPADQATASAFEAAGCPALRTLWNRTALVDFSGEWETYLAGRSAKWRSNYRRLERRLHQHGKVEHIRYRPAGEVGSTFDPRWDLYDACEAVARRSWQAQSTTGTTLCHESIRPFLRDAHQAACRRGEVDLNLLCLESQPIAFAYNYVRQGRLYGLRSGYDAAAARLGAGTVLLALMLRDSFRRKDTLLDMGFTSLELKRPVATRMVEAVRYSHFGPSARAQVLRVKRWIQQYAF